MTDRLHNIRPVLHKIIAENLTVDIAAVKSDATFESLGADSLDRIEMVMAVADAFEIDIPDEVSETWTKVSDVEEYLAKTLNN